jgi:hypothetical protein
MCELAKIQTVNYMNFNLTGNFQGSKLSKFLFSILAHIKKKAVSASNQMAIKV